MNDIYFYWEYKKINKIKIKKLKKKNKNKIHISCQFVLVVSSLLLQTEI